MWRRTAPEPGIEVIVCVHDALDHVASCLQSLFSARRTGGALSVILVDDGSSDATRAYLKEAAHRSEVTLVRHETALGYTKAVNAGLRAKRLRGYTILLNSDTIVPADWLVPLVAVMEQLPDVGLVGPLSNAASWQSVPDLAKGGGGWSLNALPPGWTASRMQRALSDGGAPAYARVPLLNGFCLMVRDRVFERIGLMDEEAFPRGYGEENDFCFRAVDAGFGIAVALDAYVYHAKSKSYGAETRRALAADGDVALRRKYPNGRVDRAVATMAANPRLAEARERVRLALGGSLAQASAPAPHAAKVG